MNVHGRKNVFDEPSSLPAFSLNLYHPERLIMEILITSFSLLTLTVIVILIGTRGRPMRFFTAFGETLLRTYGSNRGPLFMDGGICGVLVLGFLCSSFMPRRPRASGRPSPFPSAIGCMPAIKPSNATVLPPLCGANPSIRACQRWRKCLLLPQLHHRQPPGDSERARLLSTADTPTPWVKVYDSGRACTVQSPAAHQKRGRLRSPATARSGKWTALKANASRWAFALNCHRGKEGQPGLLAGMSQLIENFKL